MCVCVPVCTHVCVHVRACVDARVCMGVDADDAHSHSNLALACLSFCRPTSLHFVPTFFSLRGSLCQLVIADTVSHSCLMSSVLCFSPMRRVPGRVEGCPDAPLLLARLSLTHAGLW